MSEEFYRIKRLPPYVIAEVNDMRAAARQAGRDIIDLGMGNPDLPPPATSSTSCAKSRRSPMPTAIRPPRAFPASARPRRTITPAGSASNSIPAAKW